jgi:hypothetical protein
MREKGYSSVNSPNSSERLIQESRFKNLLKRTDEEIEEER